MTRYIARSADDWPVWFVADTARGGINVTAELICKHVDPSHAGGTLTSRENAMRLANVANDAPMIEVM